MGILYQTESFPTACIATQAVIETIAVVYELTKGTQEKLLADLAQ